MSLGCRSSPGYSDMRPTISRVSFIGGITLTSPPPNLYGGTNPINWFVALCLFTIHGLIVSKLWLYEVRIPRSLLGDQVSALRDAMNLLQKSESILVNYGSKELDEIRGQNEATGAKSTTEEHNENST